jgi:hypothetical protein
MRAEDQELERVRGKERLGALVVRSDAETPWRVDFRGGVDRPLFHEKYKQLASDAGKQLGRVPRGAKPLEFWIDNLFKYCAKSQTTYIRATHSSGGGSLIALCEASATYCVWLHRREAEASSYGPEGKLHQAVLDAAEQILGPEAIEPEPNKHTERTVAQQIDDFRLRCDWSAETLAEKANISARSVYRHISGQDNPSKLSLARYERLFSQAIGTTIVIQKTSVKVRKRQNKS